MNNKGLLHEQEMIHSLNNKRINDLNQNLKTLMSALFGVLDENEIIKAYKVDDAFKTDFVIEYNDQKRYVSMKSGKACVVHNEILINFIDFLNEYNISDETLETIKLFHYGDGTTDGTGETRQPYEETYYQLRDRIKKANKELNANMDFILAVVNRCVFKGSNDDNLEADCMYFGDVDYGTIATKRQFIANIRRRGFDYYNNLHIGPLLLRPDARYVNKDIIYRRKLDRIVCYWPNLREDVEYMSKRFNY